MNLVSACLVSHIKSFGKYAFLAYKWWARLVDFGVELVETGSAFSKSLIVIPLATKVHLIKSRHMGTTQVHIPKIALILKIYQECTPYVLKWLFTMEVMLGLSRI